MLVDLGHRCDRKSVNQAATILASLQKTRKMRHLWALDFETVENVTYGERPLETKVGGTQQAKDLERERLGAHHVNEVLLPILQVTQKDT